MKLRSRILITVVILLAVSTALLYVLISSLLFQGVSDMEQADAVRESRIVQRAMMRDLDQLIKESQHYAQWDNTYRFAETRDPADQPGVRHDALKDGLANAILMFDAQGQPLMQMLPEGDAAAGYAQVIEADFAPGSTLLDLRRHAGLLSTAAGPMLAAIEPIVPTQRQGAPHGVVVALKQLSPQFIAQLAAPSTQTQVQLFDHDKTTDAGDRSAATAAMTHGVGSPFVDYHENDYATTYTVLEDLNGDNSLVLKVTSPRRIFQQNQSVQRSVIFSYLAFGVVFGLLAVWLIDRHVLQRLEALSRDVEKVRTADDETARVNVDGHDEIGTLATYINRLLDTMEQSRSDMAAQEARWRSLVEHAPDDIFILEREGQIRFVNHAACGYQPAELVETNILDMLPEESRYAARRALEQAWDTGAPVDFEHEMVHRDRSRMWIASRIGAIHNNGEIVGLIQISNDITEQKNAQIELRNAKLEADRANQLKTQFLANMSHDIRTPMTAIMGSAELLAADSSNKERLHDNLQVLKTSGEQLMNLINDILDLATVESGELTVSHQRVSIADLVADVCRNMRPLADKKNLSLDLHFLSQMPRQITSDPKRVKQILATLISNAVKYTSAGGVSVDVNVEEDEWDHPKWLNIAVTDTGVGIENNRLDDIFNSYGRSGPHNGDGKSAGMGLTIAKRIAQLLDARIIVVSTPGKGSTFTFKINLQPEVDLEMDNAPIIRSETRPEQGRATLVEQLEHVSLQGARILVAEDSPDNQFVIRTYLEEAKASVTIAENGKDAVDRVVKASADREPYDLVLMDMQMPIMDGYTATREMRRLGVKTPIIALTAFALDYDEQKCLEAGCNAYISKPIDQTSFFSRILEQLAMAAEANDL